jgi:hypothetical protein
MNIKDQLLNIQSKEDVETIAKNVCKNMSNFKILMSFYTGKESKLAQKAAWCLSHVAKNNPSIFKPFMKDIVEQLSRKDVHAAIIRASVSVLQDIEIPENFHGNVLNACFNFIEKPSTPPAIKAFSLTTLFNLSKIYPDIQNELKLIIEERWDTETPAFKSRGKKILKQLN